MGGSGLPRNAYVGNLDVGGSAQHHVDGSWKGSSLPRNTNVGDLGAGASAQHHVDGSWKGSGLPRNTYVGGLGAAGSAQHHADVTGLLGGFGFPHASSMPSSTFGDVAVGS